MFTEASRIAEKVPESVVAEALELRRLIRAILASDQPVAISDAPAVSDDQPTQRYVHPTDRSAMRLQAYLASMRTLRGNCYGGKVDEAINRGRSAIQRLAISAGDTDTAPPMRLSAQQVADVLAFMASHEPIEPGTWWQDPADDEEPSHVCGLYLILQALEKSLRDTQDNASRVDGAAAKPSCLTGRKGSLESASRLLYVAVAAWGEGARLSGSEDEKADVLEAVRAAIALIRAHISANDNADLSEVFTAFDVLTLAEGALVAGIDPHNGVTTAPIRGALEAAAQRLEAASANVAEEAQT